MLWVVVAISKAQVGGASLPRSYSYFQCLGRCCHDPQVCESIAGGLALDFWSIDLRDALLALGEVSGDEVGKFVENEPCDEAIQQMIRSVTALVGGTWGATPKVVPKVVIPKRSCGEQSPTPLRAFPIPCGPAFTGHRRSPRPCLQHVLHRQVTSHSHALEWMVVRLWRLGLVTCGTLRP
jgi:hypothetical protein